MSFGLVHRGVDTQDVHGSLVFQRKSILDHTAIWKLLERLTGLDIVFSCLHML
jgi:hypothetical protein